MAWLLFIWSRPSNLCLLCCHSSFITFHSEALEWKASCSKDKHLYYEPHHKQQVCSCQICSGINILDRWHSVLCKINSLIHSSSLFHNEVCWIFPASELMFVEIYQSHDSISNCTLLYKAQHIYEDKKKKIPSSEKYFTQMHHFFLKNSGYLKSFIHCLFFLKWKIDLVLYLLLFQYSSISDLCIIQNRLSLNIVKKICLAKR